MDASSESMPKYKSFLIASNVMPASIESRWYHIYIDALDGASRSLMLIVIPVGVGSALLLLGIAIVIRRRRQQFQKTRRSINGDEYNQPTELNRMHVAGNDEDSVPLASGNDHMSDVHLDLPVKSLPLASTSTVSSSPTNIAISNTGNSNTTNNSTAPTHNSNGHQSIAAAVEAATTPMDGDYVPPPL
jgi:hypothetical protein